jgi:hypothetical protein
MRWKHKGRNKDLLGWTAVNVLPHFMTNLLRVPEIMTTTIPEILACLREGQNAEIVAEREEANSCRASHTVSGGREQLC